MKYVFLLLLLLPVTNCSVTHRETESDVTALMCLGACSLLDAKQKTSKYQSNMDQEEINNEPKTNTE